MLEITDTASLMSLEGNMIAKTAKRPKRITEDLLQELNDSFKRHYEWLYDHPAFEKTKAYKNLWLDDFNRFASSKLLRKLEKYRWDTIVSDRECAAFTLAAIELGF